MPEPPSVPVKVTSTGFEYHPFESGGRAGLAVTAGGVVSYRRPNEAVALTFPALSRQLPVTVAEEESGPEYDPVVQLAMPEVGSLPLNATLTGWLYQPPPSGARSAVAEVTVGASLSILKCSGPSVVVNPPFVALQLMGGSLFVV